MSTRRALSLFALASLGCAAARPAGPSGPPWHPRGGPDITVLLNVHRATAPAPAPDGASVAFLSDAPGVPQAYLASVGEAPAAESAWRRVVTIDDRIQYVAYDPRGRYLWLGRDHGGDENTQLLRVNPAGDGLTELTARPDRKVLFGALSDDGALVAYASNERSEGDFDVYVRPADQGDPRRVMEAPGHHEALAFAPDGSRLVVTEERSSTDNDLYLVDVAAATRVNLTPHTGDVRYASPAFARDGRSLWVLTDQGREFVNLARMSLPDGALAVALPEEHDHDLLAVSPAGNALALGANLDGWTELRVYSLADPARLAPGPAVDLPHVVAGAMSFSRDGRYLFVAAARASMPDEIFRVDVATGRATRVTRSDHAGIDEAALVEPTLEHVRSFDGVSVPVFVYRPRAVAPGERLPVVVSVHGGPESQATPGFSPLTQFLVGHGYMVVTPNVRGSTGYGRTFTHLDDVARREDSVRDLGEVNRWLRARPDVDPAHIAVLGGSYGGYMVLAAITLQPELWAAACDIVGIANFRTFLEHTAPYRRALREAEYGSLARDGALLDRISPLRRVDAIRAPLFVIHGTRDPRVPVGEAEQIVAALRGRGQRVEYLRFDNEGHGLARRENRVRAYGELVRFFDSVMAR